MNAENFKKSYVRWSYAVALCISILIIALIICDVTLGHMFGKNMYVMSFIVAGVVLSLLSLTWISLLNSKMFKDRESAAAPELKVIDFNDIEQCIRKEGFVPVRLEDRLTFKVSGDSVDVFYNQEKLSLVVTYVMDDTVNLDLVSKACSMLHDSTFLIRSSLHTYADGQVGLIFEVQAMVISPAELERYFGRHLSILWNSVGRHRDFFTKLVQEEEAAAAAKQSETTIPHIHDPKVLS